MTIDAETVRLRRQAWADTSARILAYIGEVAEKERTDKAIDRLDTVGGWADYHAYRAKSPDHAPNE